MVDVKNRDQIQYRRGENGSIFTALLGAVALTAVIGVAAFQTLSGPIMTAVRVKNKTLAETEMLSAAKITIVHAANQTGSGDCDGDTFVEPTAWRVGSGPTNAGLVPLTIGAPTTDPWGTSYGYCVWDVGPTSDDAACGGPGALRLDGSDDPSAGNVDTQTVLAIVSAGPDRQFQTSCSNYVDATTSVVTRGGDDMVLKYTYVEAATMVDGLWALKSGDPDTATITKDIEVGSNLQIDNASGQLWAGGGVELGDESLVTICDGTSVGLMRYNTTGQTVEVCNGTDWEEVSGGGSDVTDGLVGWWTMDDGAGATAADSSGNGLDATLVNGPTWTTSGYRDGALTFDGTDDYAEVADNALLDVTRITVSAWVYKTTANQASWGAIMSRQYLTGGNNLFWLGYDGSANDLYNCFIQTTDGFVQAIGSAATGDANRWVHVACTYDGANVIIYRNGLEIGSVAQTGDIPADSTRMVLGADNEDVAFSATDIMQARLDDVRMYNRALTPEEIGTMIDDSIDTLSDAYADYSTANNLIVGRLSAAALTSGAQYNAFVGEDAGATSANSTAAADSNTAVGYRALRGLTSGAGNTALGANALTANTTGGTNVAVGSGALQVNANGTYNTAIGNNAMVTNNSGSYNTAIGSDALRLVSSGSNSVAVGHAALYNNTASGNTAVGYQALMENRAKLYNTAVGAGAMQYSDSTTTAGTGANTAVGYYALGGAPPAAGNTGVENVAIGHYSLPFNASGEQNVSVGSGSLFENLTGSYNVSAGLYAMYNNQTGSNNVAIGRQALQGNVTKQESTAIGYLSMSNADNAAGGAITYNTAVGAYALQGSGTVANNTGTGNTALGHSALKNVTSGSNNTAIGYNAGNTTTSGSGNILIGYNTATPLATTSNHLNIGNTLYGDLANDYVGIGTASPSYRVHIASDVGENLMRLQYAGAVSGADPEIVFNRAHGTIAAKTVVSADDQLGSLHAFGYDGTDMEEAASIEFQVDGTPASGGDPTDMPGRIVFKTTPDGSDTPEERMVIKNNGYVGIGISVPTAMLHIKGDTETGMHIDGYADFVSQNSFLWMRRGRGTESAPTVVSSGDALGEISAYGYNGSSFSHASQIATVVDAAVTGGGVSDMPARLEFHVQADGAGAWMGDGASTPEMVIKNSGVVGIGTATPNEGKLEVKGGSVCVDTDSDDTASSCIANESDARLKKNVRDLEYSLDTLMKLRPVSFDWKHDDPEVLKHYPLVSRFASQPHGIGFLAQDVQKLIPEAIEAETVGDAEVQYLQLDYARLVPVVVRALQEQQNKFLELKSEGVSIKEKIAENGAYIKEGHYSRLNGVSAGPPPAAGCESDSQIGRMSIDTDNNRLYVCNGAARGWDYKELTD